MDGLLLPYRRFWIVVVVGLLALPALGQLFGLTQSQSGAEQRTLAQAPTWPSHGSDLLDLPKKIDAFINDHYGWRSELVRASAVLRHALHTSPSPNVYLGTDGWLFFNGDHGLAQVNRDPPRYADLQRFADLLSKLNAYLQQDQRRFVVGVPPNKESVYPDRLPAWLRTKSGPTEYEVLLAELAKTRVRTVDLRALLREAAQQAPVYYRTDSHWNPLGALLAYNALVTAAGQDDWRIDPARALQADLHRYSGDLARYIGLRDYLSEPESRLSIGDSPLHETVLDDRATFPTRVLDYRRQGPVVLIIGDSFSNRLFQYFLSPYVARLVWTHHTECSFDGSLIQRYQPDIVLYLPVERMIGCTDGATPKGLDLTQATQETPQ